MSHNNSKFMQCSPSGVRIPVPGKIDPEKIHPEDIAYSLSNQTRFAGHTNPPMSVAEHCWRASYEAAPGHEKTAHLHDGSEYLQVDVPTPFKVLLPQYMVLEAEVQQAIAIRFGIPYPFGDEVSRVDAVLLVTEIRDLMGGTEGWGFDHIAPLPRRIVPMPRKLAEAMWLRRLDELEGRLGAHHFGFTNRLRLLVWKLKSWILRTPRAK